MEFVENVYRKREKKLEAEIEKIGGPQNIEQSLWIDIWYCKGLSESFIEKYEDYAHWDIISECQALSEEFIERHKDNVYWHYISTFQHLSEGFIEQCKDYVDWTAISVNQALSEEFIEKHKDNVNWNAICRFHSLSEAFMARNAEYLNWDYVSIYQNLSEDFIDKHKDRVDWDSVSEYQHLSEKFTKKYKDRINWNNFKYRNKYYISEHKKDDGKRQAQPVAQKTNKISDIITSYSRKIAYDDDTISKSHFSIGEFISAASSAHEDPDMFDEYISGIIKSLYKECGMDSEKLHTPQNNPHHRYCLADHTKVVVKALTTLVQPEELSAELVVAAILHDVGKPETKTVNEKTGYDQFVGHNIKSKELFLQAAQNPAPHGSLNEVFGIDPGSPNYIGQLSRLNHTADLIELHEGSLNKQEKIANMLDSHNEHFVKDLLYLKMADICGQSEFNREAKLKDVISYADRIAEVCKRVAEERNDPSYLRKLSGVEDAVQDIKIFADVYAKRRNNKCVIADVEDIARIKEDAMER